MEVIKTRRLIIFPLTKDDLEFWLHDVRKLEKKYRIKMFDKEYEESFYNIIKMVKDNMVNDYLNYPFKTFWFIVKKVNRHVIGSIDFKNWNLEKKTIDIGYDLIPKYRGHGYMTEAVKAFCSWAFIHGIDTVYADTNIDNIKSQNVLKRCYFKEIERDELVHFIKAK